jgi:competence protein ComEC
VIFTNYSSPFKQKIPPLGLSVAVFLLVGVCWVQSWAQLLPLYLSLISVMLGAWYWWKNDNFLRCLAVFLFGIGLANIHADWALSQRLHTSLDSEVIGQVEGLPLSDEESTRFEFRITASKNKNIIGKKVRLSWYGAKPDLTAGSTWKFAVLLRPLRGLLNPGGFDFERRALEQNIAATGYVKRNTGPQKLQDGSGIDHWREELSRKIQTQVNNEQARFVQALALGDTRQLSDDDWRTLRATGLTHLIAISGFHVGLVAGFAALLCYLIYFLFPRLGRVWPRQQSMALSAMSLAFAYTALAGFALPTWRTFLMIAVVAMAKLSRRPIRISQSLALALIAILLFDPLAVLSAGFWLSFVGVAWLVWCLPSNPGQQTLSRMQQIRIFFQSQWIALLGLLPLSLWFFGQTSILGPLTNIIGIPWISLIVVPLALLGLLFSFINLSAATLFWKLSAATMGALWWGLEKISDLPQAMLWLPEPSLLSLSLAMLGAFVLLLPKALPGKWLALILFLPLLFPDTNKPEQNQVDIALIDVGQGLSVLVQTKNHALLFDAGPAKIGGFDAGESVVVPALHAIGLRRLDRIVISHGDNDHSGGLSSVYEAYSDALVIASEGALKTPSQPCLRAQKWSWDGVKFEFLHPPPFFPYLANESSCVLRIEADGKVALLTGDIGRQIEYRLVKEQAEKIRADLLQVPHHGSETSSSPEFLDAVNPSLALIASGADNRFGHPRQSVVERYQTRGIKVAASPQYGWMRLRLDHKGLEWRESRRQDVARYWHVQKSADSGYAIDGHR